MDVKKRTKAIKNKLNDLGYNVKLTQCREVLAVAHGLRNSHQLQVTEKKLLKKCDFKEMFITACMQPNTVNEYYSEILRGAKIKLNSNIVEKIYKAKEFIEENDGYIEFDLNQKDVEAFEGFDYEGFPKGMDEDEIEESLYDVIMNNKDFFNRKNTYTVNTGMELYTSVVCDKVGISFRIYMANKHEQVIYTSMSLPWGNLEDKQKEEKFLVVYNETNKE